MLSIQPSRLRALGGFAFFFLCGGVFVSSPRSDSGRFSWIFEPEFVVVRYGLLVTCASLAALSLIHLIRGLCRLPAATADDDAVVWYGIRRNVVRIDDIVEAKHANGVLMLRLRTHKKREIPTGIFRDRRDAEALQLHIESRIGR